MSGGGVVGTVGTRGGVVGGGFTTTTGRVVAGVFGEPVALGGVAAPRVPSGGVMVAGTTAGGGVCVAGLHAVVVWQSAHLVENVSWPGNVLASYSGR